MNKSLLARRRARIMRHAKLYAIALVNDSWKGGGDPAEEPIIEKNLRARHQTLQRVIDEELAGAVQDYLREQDEKVSPC